MYLSSSDLLTNSNTILKGAEDNGVGFILESNGSSVTLLNITNSSKGYTNLKEIAAKSETYRYNGFNSDNCQLLRLRYKQS